MVGGHLYLDKYCTSQVVFCNMFFFFGAFPVKTSVFWVQVA